MLLEAVSAEAKWCTDTAKSALAQAVSKLARGHTCQALAREIAWRAVIYGEQDYDSLEVAHLRAEAELERQLEQALWNLERLALDSLHSARAVTGTAEARSTATGAVETAATAQARHAYGQAFDSLIARPAGKGHKRGQRRRLSARNASSA